ncbi:DUF1016 domain-containing protein [Pseudomonas sp. MN1F]|nr:DUF1016 domain-containing protein [Pseudomonas sp. MN1F]
MRAFAEAWPDEAIVQQAVGQLPWGHNLVLLTKLKKSDERLAYAVRASKCGWPRSTLVMSQPLYDLGSPTLSSLAFDDISPKTPVKPYQLSIHGKAGLLLGFMNTEFQIS